MTDINKPHKDEAADISDLSLADLRKWAKLMGINAQRDWTVADFVRAIKAQQEASKYLQTSSGSNLEPGHARVLIHKDPTPGHSNSPIPLGLNGRQVFAPRGVEITLPIEYVGVLADAKTTITVQKKEPDRDNPQGVVVEETIQSYPFQVIEVKPHTAESQFKRVGYDNRLETYKRRAAFRDAIGKWPTTAELIDWEKNNRSANK